ncbi:MAG: hypothetical protein ACPGWR_26350 [Ardenticatenaceae bacterium]
MFRPIFQQVNAQRERSHALQRLAKEEATEASKEQQARIIEQEEAFNRDLLITALTGTTAVIHIYLGGTLFVLNGVGFLAALAAHHAVPQRESYQKWTREGLFGYTGVTVAGYFALKGLAGFGSPIGVATKVVELGLMRVLWEDAEAAQDKPVVIIESEDGNVQVHLQELAGNLAAA